MSMTNDEVVTVIQNQLDNSTAFASSALQERRAHALNAFFVRPRGDEMEG